MKTLYLARHAKSSWENMSLSDFERPLNVRGKNDVPVMANMLKTLGVKPDLIICSPSRRTKDTAIQYAEKIGYPKDRIDYLPELYEASCATLLSIIQQQPESIDSLMIVGHNQGLTELYNQLCSHYIDNIPTGGIVGLACKTDKWAELKTQEAEMKFYEYPKKYATDTPLTQ